MQDKRLPLHPAKAGREERGVHAGAESLDTLGKSSDHSQRVEDDFHRSAGKTRKGGPMLAADRRKKNKSGKSPPAGIRREEVDEAGGEVAGAAWRRSGK